MFSLTPSERKALLIIASIIFAGTLIRYFNLEAEDVADNPEPAEAPVLLIDINRASPEQLEKLPGVGPVLARRIIEYRREHKPFAGPDELKKVKGIGSKKAAKIKKYIKF